MEYNYNMDSDENNVNNKYGNNFQGNIGGGGGPGYPYNSSRQDYNRKNGMRREKFSDNPSISYEGSSYGKGGRGEQYRFGRGMGRGFSKEQGQYPIYYQGGLVESNNSHMNFERNKNHGNREGEQNNNGKYKYNDKFQENYKFQEERTQNEDSVNYPREFDLKEISKESGKYQRDTLSKDFKAKRTENYENKSNKQSMSNVRVMSERDFVRNVLDGDITADNMNSENRNTRIPPIVEDPIPLHTNSINKDVNGARKKVKGTNDEGNLSNWFCMDCEKILAKSMDFHKANNRDHRILSVDKAFQELKEKEQNKILTAIEEANAQIQFETQTRDIIQMYDKNISPYLSNVFTFLKNSNNDNTDKLQDIRDAGTRIMEDYSVGIIDMFKFMNFQSNSQDIITQNQKLLSDLKQNSFWLIFSWFKISIGLIIQSGAKVFACVKSHKVSYAPFDLTGDRLRLFSFKRDITPNKNAMIIPFESISSLFKNEDSKCFMVITNSTEEGLVTLRIDKETFWGRQFISLCLGSYGPSLRKSCFFRSCGKGRPGHHIWGGDYSKNDGSGGDSFLPCNEPLKKNPMSIVRGLIASRYGSSDKSTIFRIFVKGEESASADNPSKENFCFGQVEEGMETIEFIANQSDITRAVIKDSGCFLVLK